MADQHGRHANRRRQRKGAGEGDTKRHRVKKSDLEDAEAKKLSAIIEAQKPASGTNPLALTEQQAEAAGYAAARKFDELPLSRHTKEGLSQHKFETLTTIQRAALPHALAGRDILGAAKTGSGKTLAFLIPIVEKLFRARWTRLDGLGALVLTPTRELALQIFQELRKVGTHHDFSAGLLIGGKNVKEEQASINRMNILVATPGRLLQHMDETPGFGTENLQMLVLDEADRLLDMGFAATLDAILDVLPTEGRQTMLFSATQTKSVKDLARLSLRDPEYLAVHETSDTATPLKLQQAVAVVAPEHKMDALWSFIKSHLLTKTIVFLSTCKQVRFFHEVFKKLRPGVPLRALHGGMKQMKRMVVFQEFRQAEHMVLFATDIAGRGLDFPAVDWVVQVDCPEDTAAYIHRVGRTARYLSAGRALLMLTPSEATGMKAALAAAKIPIKPIKINPAKQQSIGPALQALLSKTTQLKEWGQRALVAYVRSVFLAPSKDVFDVSQLPLDAIATSWGLAATPRMRFLRRVGGSKEVVAELGASMADDDDHDDGKAGQDKQHRQQHDMETDDADDSDQEDGQNVSNGIEKQQEQHDRIQKQEKADKQRQQRKADQLVGNHSRPENNSDDDDFLLVKQRDVFSNQQEEPQLQSTQADGEAVNSNGGLPKKKKLKIKVGKVSGQRVVFDSHGNPLEPLAALAADPDELMAQQGLPTEAEDGDGVYIVAEEPEQRFNQAAQVMKLRDKQDKARLKELRAALKAERKAKRKAALAEESGEAVVQLGGQGTESGAEESEDNDSSQQEYASEDDQSVTSSEDEGDAQTARTPGRVEVAHSGMQRLSNGSLKRPADSTYVCRELNKRSKPANELSLAEQEALVLARIGASKTM